MVPIRMAGYTLAVMCPNVLNMKMRNYDVEFKTRRKFIMQKITKAVIPAAGLGTRFLPATKACPKEMLPIVDKPTIQYIIEEALDSGITDILIISGRAKRAIEDHFDRSENGAGYWQYQYSFCAPKGTTGTWSCNFVR